MYSSSQRTNQLIVGLLLAASICRASITLNPIDRGTYTATGAHSPEYHNYVIGSSSSDPDFISNNFFVFDLSSVLEQVISAEFWIESNWYISDDPSETFTVYDITGSIPAIRDGSAGLADAAGKGKNAKNEQGERFYQYRLHVYNLSKNFLVNFSTAPRRQFQPPA